MKNKMKILLTMIAGCSAEATTAQQAPPLAQETIELEKAKLIIEHNATDEDTGFQGFVDGEAWKQLQIRDPDGKLAMQIEAKGNLRTLGFTELFFETEEPENAVVPIEELLERMPEGDYELLAKTVDGLLARGVATLSHTIPEAPVVTTPADGAVVDAATDLVVRWDPVTSSLCEDSVTVTHYELIVERSDQPSHPGFGAETFNVHVPASVTAMRVPHEFLEPGTEYKFEVLAIEANGNQTIRAGAFSTL
jgi:hypothetical protein